ncbi:uncharacterized protein LOC133928111 [Phragmites australis]|uniref:uncharacterized protein LOC133928111 n=1 Tax=Phragmites australis TaxID=29695 RepID=UPI002D77A90F|nr:uncharacterized protein LOC133928111 [Phragmites australis]
MGIQRSELKTGVEPFHGITPNSSTMPLDQIELPVTFGELDNFRIEKLTFDVADFDMAYNAILGHPMLGKFMVIVQYVYQMHKATTKVMDPKLVSLANAFRYDDTTKGENNDGSKDKKKAAGGVKAVPLDPSELAKTVKIGVSLDPK